MSTIDNDIIRKIDRSNFSSPFEMENDSKSLNETTASDNSFHEVAAKKRKLNNPKMKQIKKAKSQSSVSNQDWEISTRDVVSELSLQKCVPHPISNEAHDIYCWICHKTENTAECSFCPRAFHITCVQSCFSQTVNNDKDDWICPECVSIMVAECTLNIVPRWKNITIQELNEMLLFVLLRLYHISGSSHFQIPVDDQTIKDYYTIIRHPVYMDLLKEKVTNNTYCSVQSFHSDFKWILHNCTIYNGVASVLTNYAKNIDKVCSKEINLLKSCPECFQRRMPFMIKLLKEQSKNSPTKSLSGDKSWDFSVEDQVVNEMWMTKLCNSVHSLVWVRLHNYPVWPGKLISLDDESALVLFFGDYDLNVVPLGSICIHTQSNHKRLMANIANFTNRRASAPMPSANSVSKEYQLALEQLNLHLDNIKKKYDYFVIPPKKIEFNIQAGVEYYEKIRLQSSLDSDVIVVNSFEDASGMTDDISEIATPDKQEFRVDQDTKSDKLDDHNSLSHQSSIYQNKIKPQKDSSGFSFLKSFESGVQCLLSQFKKDYTTHLKLTNQELETDDWSSAQFPISDSQYHDFRQQTDPVSVSSVSVQFTSKEFEKDEELRSYIKYLEKSLEAAEIELRRQEILSAIHHEENMLEFSKQQKEMKKLYDIDVMEVVKHLRTKFDDKFARAIQKVKLNEWCAFCSKLARFYCCWNTCYCNHECQSKHWEMHKATCTQVNRSVQPVILPKNPYPTNANSTIPSMMQQHMIPRNGEMSMNGSNVLDFAPNHTIRISEETRMRIVDKYNAGRNYKKISEDLDFSCDTISQKQRLPLKR